MKKNVLTCLSLSFCLLAIGSLCFGRTETRRIAPIKKAPVKVQPTTAAKVEVKSASVASVNITPGAKPVTITLTGTNLNLITSAALVSNNWPVKGTKVTLGEVNPKKRNVSFYADAKTKAVNNCQLRLIAGKQTITLSADILNVSVSRPPANVTRTSDTPPADTTPENSGNTSGTADNLNTTTGTSSEANSSPPSSTASSAGSSPGDSAGNATESTGVLKSIDPDTDTDSGTRTRMMDADRIASRDYCLDLSNGDCIPITDVKLITSIASIERRFDDAELLIPVPPPAGPEKVLITKYVSSGRRHSLHEKWNAYVSGWRRPPSGVDPWEHNTHLLFDARVVAYDEEGRRWKSVITLSECLISQFQYIFKDNRLTEEIMIEAKNVMFKEEDGSCPPPQYTRNDVLVESLLNLPAGEVPVTFFNFAASCHDIDLMDARKPLGPMEVSIAKWYGRESRTLRSWWENICQVTGEESTLDASLDNKIVDAYIKCIDQGGNEVFRISLNKSWISQYQYDIDINKNLVEKIIIQCNEPSFGVPF